MVSHRVVEVQSLSNGETRFITKGDNNPEADATPVDEEQVKGVVWYNVPWIGYLSVALGGDVRTWLIPLAGGALLIYSGGLLVGGLVGRIRKARREVPTV